MRLRVWVLLVAGLILMASCLVALSWNPTVASRTVSSPNTMTYLVNGFWSPITVQVTWETVSGSPGVNVGFCNPAPPAPQAGCSDPIYLYGDRAGAPINASIPSGAQLFVEVLGPLNSTAHITIHEAPTNVALLLLVGGSALFVTGVVKGAVWTWGKDDWS